MEMSIEFPAEWTKVNQQKTEAIVAVRAALAHDRANLALSDEELQESLDSGMGFFGPADVAIWRKTTEARCNAQVRWLLMHE